MHKLLGTGKTDLLDKFVSMRTRRAFKAMLAWDAEAGQSELRICPSQIPSAQNCCFQNRSGIRRQYKGCSQKGNWCQDSGSKTAAKATTPKAPRKTSVAAGKTPSAVLGRRDWHRPGRPPRGHEKAVGLHQGQQLARPPRTNAPSMADAKLLPVLGAESVNMFALAGIVGKHLG